MKETREHDSYTDKIPEKDKDYFDEKDKMNMDHVDILEYRNEKGNTLKQEYFEERCRTAPDKESLINTESVPKQNGQERIKVNFDPLDTIDPELENGLKGLSVSGSTSFDNSEQQVKSNGTGNELEAMENEMNKREGINCDHKNQTIDIGDSRENEKPTTVGEHSQVKILIFLQMM